MPPASQRRQGLARPPASQSAHRRGRDVVSTSGVRRTYGGSSSSQRMRNRHEQQQQQQQQEDDDDQAEEEEQDEQVEEQAQGEELDTAGGPALEDDDDDDAGNGAYSVKKRQKLPLSDAVKTVVKGIGRVEIERKINDLVRLALFSEYRRVPIRRDEITKKVLDKPSSRAFPYVFNRAQAILREVFCFEMVELRARGTDNEAITQAAAASDASKGKKRARPDETDRAEEVAGSSGPTSKCYVVRSILPSVVIKAMAEPNPAVSAASLSSGESLSDAYTASTGALLDWQKSDGQLGSLGLVFLILSLILLNGRALSDDQFRALLRRLGLEGSGQLPDTLRPDSLAVPPPEMDASQSHSSYRRAPHRNGGAGAPTDTIAHPSTLQSLLSQMIRQGYLETTKTDLNTGVVSRRGGGRLNGGGRGGETNRVESIEWKWGPRAEVEIGEEAVATFIRDVYIDADPDNAPPGTVGGSGTRADSGEESEDDDVRGRTVDASRFVGRSSGSRPSRGRASTQGGVSTGRRNAGLDDREQRERREKQSQMLRREIERAAGSQLVG